jgi:NADH dehydrogenase
VTEAGGTAAGRAPHRVVIIGSGFGGLFAARAFRRSAVGVTVIDRTNHHLFQPLLYQVTTGILSEGQIAPPTRDVLRRFKNVEVQLGLVTDIDLEARIVHSTQGIRMTRTPYDSLIVAPGVDTSYFGHDEFAQWAPGMKTIDDALELRGRIFGAFEMAETEPDEEVRRQWMTFIVVGGGPTGVEMAGQIAELSERALRNNFRTIDPSKARVLLFEGGDKVLGSFGDRLAAQTARVLTKLGVEVHTNAMVADMDERGVVVHFDGGTDRRFEGRTKVWAAGMKASPLGKLLAERSGADMDRVGRIKVLPDCTLPGHPEVFVVGDLMALDDLPGMAEVAMQSGRHAAEQIKRLVGGDTDPGRPLRYHDLGSMATISRFRAVARIHKLSVGGFVGWVLWLVVHLTFLTGFKNRFAAVVRWGLSFIGTSRAERTITFQQIVGRLAIARQGQVGQAGPESQQVGYARAFAPPGFSPSVGATPGHGADQDAARPAAGGGATTKHGEGAEPDDPNRAANPTTPDSA